MIPFSVYIALSIPLGQSAVAFTLSNCKPKGDLCSSTSDCCRGLGLHCRRSVDVADSLVPTSSDSTPGTEKRCVCIKGFPSSSDGRGCGPPSGSSSCASGGSWCDSTFPCCDGYACSSDFPSVFLSYCIKNASQISFHDFEVAKRDFPGPPPRVYLSNFSAVSFLIVKLVLKIFVIIACCALLQDCLRRKRRGGGGNGSADTFDVLPLCRVPGAAFRSGRGGGVGGVGGVGGRQLGLSSNNSSVSSSASRRRRSRSRERRLGAAARRANEPEEPPPSYDEVTAPPPAYEVAVGNDDSAYRGENPV